MGAFRFKQFEVVQEHSAMKVNTDAVLLGAWMSVGGGVVWAAEAVDAAEAIDIAGAACGQEGACNTLRALDIGTGTGVIALMAGQRLAQAGVSAHIDAVEIDEGACQDAAANFAAAPWEGISFGLHNVPLQEFAQQRCASDAGSSAGADEDHSTPPGKYNLIFSNPPYFISSLKNDSEAKTTARHTDTLSQRELLFHSTALLSEGGIFSVILPVVEGEELLRKVEFMAGAAVNHSALFPSRICYVHTVERKPAKRLMLEFVKCHPTARPALQREQLVMMSNGSYTPEYTSLVSDFYLWG